MLKIVSYSKLNNQKIKSMKKLKDNWNGYGAKKIPKTIIHKMKKIIRGIKIQPEIFPTALPSIQFEYEKENGDYLEFNLLENGKIKVFLMMADGYKNTEIIKNNINTINEKINIFFNQ